MKRITKDPAQRKSEIINAAHALFQTKGYANASMNDIMNELGIAKGTIYHYFNSKEDLLEAVVEQVVDKSITKMREILEQPGTARERFKRLVRLGNIAGEHSALLEQLHRPENAGIHTRLMAVAINKQAPLYAAVIEQGCEEGVFNTTTPLESAEYILAAFQFLTDAGVFPWSQETLQRRMKAAPRIIESILGADHGTLNEVF